jgi:hypothetical protein
MAPPESQERNRRGLIQAITDPLRLFALVVLAVEAMVLGSANITSNPQNQFMLYAGAVAIVLVTIIMVGVIAFIRPDALRGQSPVNLLGLGDSLSEDVWNSMDGVLGNLESEDEQTDAWATLMSNVSRLRPGELETVRQFRNALVEGIRVRAEARGRIVFKEALKRMESRAGAMNEKN